MKKKLVLGVICNIIILLFACFMTSSLVFPVIISSVISTLSLIYIKRNVYMVKKQFIFTAIYVAAFELNLCLNIWIAFSPFEVVILPVIVDIVMIVLMVIYSKAMHFEGDEDNYFKGSNLIAVIGFLLFLIAEFALQEFVIYGYLYTSLNIRNDALLDTVLYLIEKAILFAVFILPVLIKKSNKSFGNQFLYFGLVIPHLFTSYTVFISVFAFVVFGLSELF